MSRHAPLPTSSQPIIWPISGPTSGICSAVPAGSLPSSVVPMALSATPMMRVVFMPRYPLGLRPVWRESCAAVDLRSATFTRKAATLLCVSPQSIPVVAPPSFCSLFGSPAEIDRPEFALADGDLAFDGFSGERRRHLIIAGR